MAKIALLDGGMGQELVARSGDEPTPLWATRVMLDHPGLVRAIHDDYFAAGATIATTNTYAIHHDRLERFGLDGQFAALHLAALEAAEAARAAHGSGRIAGSIGPLVATYRDDVVLPVDEAAPKVAEIAHLLAPKVDFILLETLSTVAQAEGALKGAVQAGKPVWLSVSVHDRQGDRLRSGEPLADLAPLVAHYGPAAVLANCSVPEAMGDALAVLGSFGLPFGAYANGFTHISDGFLEDAPTVAALTHRHDLTPEKYADFAMGWVGQGASIVGGCCDVGPAHIAELARRLREAGHEIV
ncbi:MULTISPECIES: homocysteine S-methyltransferase family protein [Gemmobacter]|jgi:homocysteine S-methyltransferase|uniref:Homocysteine S-methyltransferase n=2 Tax=Gemmobacter TaxID=204456 RepID=A0A2T6AVP0_9RHOB|nr:MULTISPECIES: homocysteine S-methyltransferase family protein [Gemmobacter]PTX47883.1 homocysteine S-methyltransferase [Gemmobacter caeni]TWI97395.1 homocysteine S-methyltransferase [Gemmobacter caeni]GHC31031.1 homocysteine S-methyltransferase [Gemmobacter nanjingensis]